MGCVKKGCPENDPQGIRSFFLQVFLNVFLNIGRRQTWDVVCEKDFCSLMFPLKSRIALHALSRKAVISMILHRLP